LRRKVADEAAEPRVQELPLPPGALGTDARAYSASP
jgi:hypothetical protein